MDENNNTKDTYDVEKEKTTISGVKKSNINLYVAVGVVALAVVGIAIALILGKADTPEIFPDGIVAPVGSDEVASATTTQILPPEKISAGEALPEGFPKELILEDNATINEGYSINYEDVVQKTGNLSSDNVVSENYENYLAYLEKDGWSISNKYESENLSFIYALKEAKEVSVTISTGETSKSQMTVSLLER